MADHRHGGKLGPNSTNVRRPAIRAYLLVHEPSRGLSAHAGGSTSRAFRTTSASALKRIAESMDLLVSDRRPGPSLKTGPLII